MAYQPNPDRYDFRKWSANTAGRRRRHPAVKWLIGFSLLLGLTGAVLDVALPGAQVRDYPNILPVLVPAIIGASLSPFGRDSWLMARGRAAYDEFERDAYARATTIAYGLFLALITATFGYLWAASANGWPMPRLPQQWATWAAALLITGALLPLLLAEILVPPPPPPEEWDE